MDPMERALRRSATVRMTVIGTVGVLSGIAVFAFGALASNVRLLAFGVVFFVAGIAQIVRGQKHLRGD